MRWKRMTHSSALQMRTSMGNNIIEWNISSNPELEPHTEGGCSECLGAITIDGNNVIRNEGYYVMGHISRFVPPGAERIQSNYIDQLPNVAFLTPSDQVVLIVMNDTKMHQFFNINNSGEKHAMRLLPLSVSTIVFN